uniref:isoinhibitor K-like n=1 Tax=Styela clava TaxID=7725 RepID=UPI00193A461B|nr:isoinhibitor K-like [Styela clava]
MALRCHLIFLLVVLLTSNTLAKRRGRARICPRPYYCYSESETGPCRAFFRKFYYNTRTGRCELFIYGGCQGNANRFDNYHECSATCGRWWFWC